MQLPLICNVPDEAFDTATDPAARLPPWQLPLIDAVAGFAAVNWRQILLLVDDLLVTLALSVTPSLSVKIPVPALLMRSQVALAVMVIV